MIAAIFSKRIIFELFFIASMQLHDVLPGIAYRLAFTASPYKTFRHKCITSQHEEA